MLDHLHFGIPQLFVVGVLTWAVWGLQSRTTVLHRQDPIKYPSEGVRAFKTLCAVFYFLMMFMLYWGGFFG